MSGRHRFQGLIADFGPNRQRRVETKKAELMAETPLRELSQAMAVIQLPDVDHHDFRDTKGNDHGKPWRAR